MKQYTQIFGILNVTPDSCYDGGRYLTIDAAIERAREIEQEGADFIDIGGESTRPGAAVVSEEEEIRRVIPIIKELKRQIKIPISIDTYKPKVAELALEAGASLINDISGCSSLEMIAIAHHYAVPISVMHMQGTPATMQKAPHYPGGVLPELLEWFERKIDSLLKAKISPSKIILDPGIGFGKTAEQNVEIIQNLPLFKKLGFPLLLGLSRKSFIMHYVKKPREELLPATLAVASFAIQQKVEFLRVHDVGSHRDAITILDGILS